MQPVEDVFTIEVPLFGDPVIGAEFSARSGFAKDGQQFVIGEQVEFPLLSIAVRVLRRAERAAGVSQLPQYVVRGLFRRIHK